MRIRVESVVFSVFVLMAPAARAAPDALHQAIAADQPLIHYRLDESAGPALNYGTLGQTFDAVFEGTPDRAVPTLDGDAGVRLDDAEDYLESGSVVPAQLTGNPSFSIEAVFFVPGDGSATFWAPILQWGPADGIPNLRGVYFGFSHDDAEEIFAGFYNAGRQTVEPVGKGQWHHVVWVRSGGNPANVGSVVYVDGQAVALEDDLELTLNGGMPIVEATALRINRGQDFERFFTGTLDEVALYDRALSRDRVEAHWAAWAGGACRTAVQSPVAWWPADCGVEDVAGANDAALAGGAARAPGMVGNAFTFDGNDDYGVAGHDDNLNPVGPFSVSLWLKAPAQNGQVLLIDKSHGFVDGTGWALQSESDGRVAFFFGVGGGPSAFIGVGTTRSLFDDRWHHIAGVWTGAEFRIHVDGVLDATNTVAGAPVGNQRDINMGSAWGGGARTRYLHGLLDEVAYWDRALDDAEILTAWQAGSAGLCKPGLCQAGRCRDEEGDCRACGQPVSTGVNPTATDALAILNTAVSRRTCHGCICDVDTSGTIVATDALLTLQRSVSLPVTLRCGIGCEAGAR
jgi:hypothetical protein